MFNFNNDYILENDIVRLMPLKANDLQYLLHFATEEPELWHYSLVQANSPAKMKSYIESAIEGRLQGHSYPFVVFDKRYNAYAGSTRFYDIQLNQATLQLGYTWYGKKYQGTGLNRNCKYLLLDFAFSTLQMARVEFRADYNNSRSIRAMKRIGCVEEGVLRSNTSKPSGGRRDSIILSVLRDEWFDSVQDRLSKLIMINQ